MAQHDDPGSVVSTFVRGELPASHRLHAEQRKEILRNRDGAQTLRRTGSRELAVANAVEGEIPCDIRKRRVPLAQVLEVCHLRRLTRQPAAVPIGDPHELTRVAEGQGADEDGVGNAEDGGAGADTKPDDQRRKPGEGGIAPEGSRRVAEVLPEPVEERRPSLVAPTDVEGCRARLEFTLMLAHAWL